MPNKEKNLIFPDFASILLKRRSEVKGFIENNEESKFYESIILQYSLIESTLKYMVFLQMALNLGLLHVRMKTSQEDFHFKMDELKLYCQNLSFYQAQHLALCSNVINEELYKKIDKIRIERNDWIHQTWLLQLTSTPNKLKEDLERVNDTFWEVTQAFGDLVNDIKHPWVFDLNVFFSKGKTKTQTKKNPK
ncbi:MAG: hypothetical protein WCE46_06815 [Methanoregula sp.]|uniref:hypothetical protein n=1 Tax=Methanoregula sp. TaxID=2052170 RepID=UPI003C763AF9